MDKEQNIVERQKKAEARRYKKSMLSELNIDTIQQQLEEMWECCDEIRYFTDDEETLLNALDGDEEAAWEFKMLFSDLSAECEMLYDLIYDEHITEHFDDFFVGITSGGNGFFEMVGYDDFQEDYYRLVRHDFKAAATESGKRIKRLTKDEIISVAGQCFGLAISYFDIKYKYDYLKAEFDFVNDKNASYLKAIKDIETAYNEADEESWYEYSDSYRRFNKLISALPDKAWIE